MSLTKDDVKQLADLARLQLTVEEIDAAELELDSILQYVDRLQKIDTSGVEPMTLPARADGWRQDVAIPCDDLSRELIFSNFPSRSGDLLKTPAVFENPKK